jgi:hypothetical protein
MVGFCIWPQKQQFSICVPLLIQARALLDDPARQNSRKNVQPKTSVIDFDSDDDIVVDLGNAVASTSHSERGRGRGTAIRSRRGRGSRARGTASSRGRVSGDLNMFAGLKIVIHKTRDFFWRDYVHLSWDRYPKLINSIYFEIWGCYSSKY